MEGKLAETNNLLNEVAEILDEAIGGQASNVPATQTGHPLMAILSTFLNNKTPMPETYGSPQETQRTIYEEHSTPTLETENEHNELSS